MSKYTTEVRFICEKSAGLSSSVDNSNVEQVIKNSLPQIFNFNFPIFDEKYRTVLETKILRHYYTREIGFETVGLWKLKLNTKLNEIMPLYNQFYKSELLEFNPMYDVDTTRQHKNTENGTRITDTLNTTNLDETVSNDQNINTTLKNTSDYTDNATVSDDGQNIKKHSDTPQGAITDLLSNKYMSDADVVDNQNTTTSKDNSTTNQNGNTNSDTTAKKITDSTNTLNGKVNTDITNTEDYIETVTGKQGTGSYSDLLLKFRETFLNIDMLIIDELEELFMGIW